MKGLFVMNILIDMMGDIKNLPTYLDIIRHKSILGIQHFSNKASVSWPTGRSILDKLSEKKLVATCENDSIKLLTENYFFLGISIGALHYKVSLVDFGFNRVDWEMPSSHFHELFKSICFSANKENKSDVCLCIESDSTVSEIKTTISEIIKKVVLFFDDLDSKQLLSIGIALPGLTDSKSGTIFFSPNISALEFIQTRELVSFDILSLLSDHDIPLGFFHDTVSAIVYEKEFLYSVKSSEREFSECPNIASVYLGSGLGAGVILNNSLSSRTVAEIGHLITYYYGKYSSEYIERLPLCACGHKNCIENLIRRLVFQAETPSAYNRATSNYELRSFASQHYDEYQMLKHYIGIIMNVLINVLNVQAIVLCGRVLLGIETLRSEIIDIKTDCAIKPLSSNCKILKGSQHLDGVAAGAAIMSYHKIFQNRDMDIQINW